MSKKFTMILTEQDIEKALNQDYQDTINELVECADLMLKGNTMLVENQLSEQEYQVLQEGLWEKVKYGLAKLGRYKAGMIGDDGKSKVKIFGKKEIDQASAAKIQSILDKKGNEMIKQLNDTIKKQNPEFPNNKEGKQFLNTVEGIATIYDAIVASTKKKEGEEGYLQTSAANSLIADLAEYVKKFLDVDLAAVYTVMDSEKEKVDDKDNGELLTDEVEDIEDKAADIRAKLQAKGGDKKYDTTRMGKEGLKSNKLPMLLAGVGASLGAFSWLTNTEWFKSLFQETYQYTDPEKIKSVIETKTQVLNDIKPGEGVYKLLGRVTNHPLDGNSNPSEMVEALKQIGGGDAHKGVDLLCQDGGVMMKPDEAAKGLHDLVNNPDQYDKLGDMFKGAASGTGKLAEPGSGLNTTLYGTVAGKSLTSLLVKKLPIIITKLVVKTGVKTGAGYAIAKGFGAVLGPIGIGLVTTGALVKLMRMKGLKQSRAKTLNDLLQSLQPVLDSEATQPSVIKPKENPVVKDNETVGKNNKETLFNDLVGFFKFTYNNRKMASPEIFVKPIKKSEGGKQLEIPFEESVNKYIKNILMENKNLILISEGKFIKDPELIKMLKEKSGIDSNKLKFFEGFLTRLEIIRNKVKKMNNTGDKVMDKYIQKLKANPIMKTDFANTFNVSVKKPQRVENLGAFINSFIEMIYKGNFRGTTFKEAGGMVSKMGMLGSVGQEKHSIKKTDDETFKKTGKKFTGGGNINKVSTSPMGESYLIEAEVENKGIKQNSIQFIVDIMGLFQYMYKLKKEGKLSTGKKTGELKRKGGEKPKEESPKPKQESIQKPENKFLKEEVKRILTLMHKI